MHSYNVFAIGDEKQPVRFAACELSNSVWGFSVRRDDSVEAQGASQDGSLRYEHRLGACIDGRSDAVSSSAVLIDAASGQLLVDCAAWASSRISPNPDGSLFLHLQQNSFDVLFRIEPAIGHFRNHGEGGPNRPLADLANAVEEARRAAGQQAPYPTYRRISPNGTIRVDLASVEWSNSHWVNSPRVTEIASGRVVLDLWGTDWDATASFPGGHSVRLDLRRYRHGGGLAVEIDLARDTYRITSDFSHDAALPAAPLAEVANALEASSRRAASAAALVHGMTAARRWGMKPNPWAAWRSALLILTMAFVAIAGMSFLSLHVSAPGTQISVPLATIAQPKVQLIRPD